VLEISKLRFEMKAYSSQEEPVSPVMASSGIFGLKRARKGVDICLA
jgi:hypothetical protein